MTNRYHVTVDRQGEQWRAVCPALMDHGAVTGGETREEALSRALEAVPITGLNGSLSTHIW